MSEIQDLFFELLFGSGAMFGLIILISIALIIAVLVKYSSSIFMVIFLFLAWEYFGHITATSLNAWYFIISLVVTAFLGAIFANDVTSKKH